MKLNAPLRFTPLLSTDSTAAEGKEKRKEQSKGRSEPARKQCRGEYGKRKRRGRRPIQLTLLHSTALHSCAVSAPHRADEEQTERSKKGRREALLREAKKLQAITCSPNNKLKNDWSPPPLWQLPSALSLLPFSPLSVQISILSLLASGTRHPKLQFVPFRLRYSHCKSTISATSRLASQFLNLRPLNLNVAHGLLLSSIEQTSSLSSFSSFETRSSILVCFIIGFMKTMCAPMWTPP